MSLEAQQRASAGSVPSCQVCVCLEVWIENSVLYIANLSLSLQGVLKTLICLCASSFVTFVAPIASMACAKLGARVTSITGALFVSGGFLISIFASSVVFLYISMGVIVGELNYVLCLTFSLITKQDVYVTALEVNYFQWCATDCLLTPFRNGFCTIIPVLLSCDSTVLQKKVSNSVCNWAFWDGVDLCPRPIHSAASGPICLARSVGPISVCGNSMAHLRGWPEPSLPSTGAMLILGGLMLNLVASGMLLRPIKVKPPVSNPTSSPTQKSPAVSLKSSSEKEYAKNCLSGSSHLSNGVSKSDSFPSSPRPHRDSENPAGQCTQGLQDNSANSELTRLVLNGVNGHEPHHDVGQCKPTTPDNSTELNGSMNGSTIVGFPSHTSLPSEVTVRKAKVLDFSLLKDPFFCIYTWSLVFSQLAYFIPYFHLSARARTLGIDAMDASFIISVAGETLLKRFYLCNVWQPSIKGQLDLLE